jgi:hypothetical protein
VLLFFLDKEIERLREHGVIDCRGILFPTLYQSFASGAFPELELRDGFREGRQFFGSQLKRRTPRNVKRGHTSQRKVPEPFPGFRAMLGLWNSHDLFDGAPQVPNNRLDLKHPASDRDKENRTFNEVEQCALRKNRHR